MSLPLDEDTVPPDLDPRADGTGTNPPRGFVETLRQLGPGLIIAGSIVGSGELIATTKTGAQGGITLLWLIIAGCVIKVFVQIELGRHAITHGQTTLAALNTLPGPRKRVSWILWFWLAMMACTVGQLGGIVGGVGQALAISCPITGDYLDAIRIPAQGDVQRFLDWEAARLEGTEQWTSLSRKDQERISAGQELMAARLLELGERGDSTLQTVRQGGKLVEPVTADDRYWATAAALVTVALLYNGRYGLIQNFSTALVVTFTFITVGNVLSLQATPQWRIPLEEWLQGLMFRLPKSSGGPSPLVTALATFGIIGVGATELIQYPYWCIEKGYAKYTGRRTNSDDWAMRARGWMRVMKIDAYVSMAIYTVATLAFFVMGVAVLHRKGLDPDGMRMVSTLAQSYVPVFGEYAKWLFLVGAIAVLYSTFLVAIAGQTRLYTDALKVWGLMDRHNQRVHNRSVSAFGVVLPLLCLSMYLAGINPVTAVLLSGTMQALLLPMIGFGALYFRWKATDERLKPGPLWDCLLVISFVGLLIAGGYGTWAQVTQKLIPLLRGLLQGVLP